jgi:hypothetical protein
LIAYGAHPIAILLYRIYTVDDHMPFYTQDP